MKKSIGKAALLAAATTLFGALPAAAQTYGGGQPLPAPQVVRVPTSFGGSGSSASFTNQAVPSGEFATHVHGVGDRATATQQMLAERYAQEKALIAQRGAGKPIVLRKARY